MWVSWTKEYSDVRDILSKNGTSYSPELDISPALFHDLFDYYREIMPYAYQKARDKDPYEWIEIRLDSLFARTLERNERM